MHLDIHTLFLADFCICYVCLQKLEAYEDCIGLYAKYYTNASQLTVLLDMFWSTLGQLLK